MNIQVQYFDAVKRVLDYGVTKQNRTGISTLVNNGPVILQHNMEEGFPLLNVKKTAFKPIRVELEGFIKGITSKKWYQERGCSIWDEWCNPQMVPYGNDEKTKKLMAEENDLGAIYGHQWRRFNEFTEYDKKKMFEGYEDEQTTYINPNSDQLKIILQNLNKNPDDRRLVCSAWNPLQLNEMALPPCHLMFLVQHVNGKLNLSWIQRSADAPLGVPFNIASYALLLHLISRHVGMKPGILTGFFVDFHIYENQLTGVTEMLKNDPTKYNFCDIETEGPTDIFKWEYTMTKSKGYKDNHYPHIYFPVAV